jgi:hypothetical protein
VACLIQQQPKVVDEVGHGVVGGLVGGAEMREGVGNVAVGRPHNGQTQVVVHQATLEERLFQVRIRANQRNYENNYARQHCCVHWLHDHDGVSERIRGNLLAKRARSSRL